MSVFRYPGGKSRVQDTILQYAPDEYSEYREPFVGGGGIFFAISSEKKRWINDMHPDLIAVYKELRDRPDDFIGRCSEIKPMLSGEPEAPTKKHGKLYNKRLGEKFKELIENREDYPALSYFFINRTVWAGRVNYNMPSRLYYSNPQGWNIVKTDKLHQAAQHIKETKITCGDFVLPLQAPGEDVWIYCFIPGSLVRCSDEDWVPIENVEIGNVLWGDRKILETTKRNYVGAVVSIKTQGSPYILTVTPEHPVLRVTKRKEGTKQDSRSLEEFSEAMEFVQANNLQVGDYVCIPSGGGKEVQVNWDYKQISNQKDRVSFCPDDELLGELIGLYLAEGYFQKLYKGNYYSIAFSFGLHETKTLAARVKEIVAKVFGINASVRTGKPHPSVTQVIVFSRDVANFMEQWVLGKIAYEKRCNHKLMTAPLSVQLSILKGWLQGDGGIDRQRKGKSKLTGTSTSKKLALQMYHIALRCGLRPSFKLRTKNTEYFNRLPQGTTPKILRPAWDVYFSIANDIRKLGWYSDAKRCCATRRIVDGYILSRIREINSLKYNGVVYNLRVDGDHLLCVDNIVSHNCDPPYVVNTDMPKTDQQYEYNFTIEDHERFIDEVIRCKHRVCISYDDCDQVREWFSRSQFTIHSEKWTYSGSSQSVKKIGKEVIVTNY